MSVLRFNWFFGRVGERCLFVFDKELALISAPLLNRAILVMQRICCAVVLVRRL